MKSFCGACNNLVLATERSGVVSIKATKPVHKLTSHHLPTTFSQFSIDFSTGMGFPHYVDDIFFKTLTYHSFEAGENFSSVYG